MNKTKKKGSYKTPIAYYFSFPTIYSIFGEILRRRKTLS